MQCTNGRMSDVTCSNLGSYLPLKGPETLFSGFVDLMFFAYARVAGETVFSSWMLDFAQQQFKSARLSREVATVSIQLIFFQREIFFRMNVAGILDQKQCLHVARNHRF